MRKRDITEILFQSLFLILGVVFILLRSSIFANIVALTAIVMIAVGLWGLVLFYINNKHGDMAFPPIMGLILLVFGVALFLLRDLAAGIFPIIMGLFMLLMGIVKLCTVILYKQNHEPYWWASLPAAALYLVGGVFVLTNIGAVNTAVAVVFGIYLIIYALFNIGEILLVYYKSR